MQTMDAVFSVDAIRILAGCAVVTLGAAVQGSIGFGFAILSAPVLLLLDARFVPGPLLLCGFVLTLLITYREREAVDFGGLRWAVVGRVLGTVAAAALLAEVPQNLLALLFGSLVLLGVAVSASGVRVRPGVASALAAGTLSGFMGTISSIGGPPIALIYQAERGPRVRGTLSGFFLIGTAVSVTALWWIGHFGVVELVATATLLPGVLLGYVISVRTAPAIDRRGTRPFVLLLSAVAGVVVIVRALM